MPEPPRTRRWTLQRLANEKHDLLVIGGGITGCGIARLAALLGLKVALVEREDFGAGTSGRSSKLVHGGLRYLLQGDVRMVREAAREREALRATAPHLVRPLEMVLPLYPEQPALVIRLGFWVYDRLAGVGPEDRHRLLSGAETARRAPGLRAGLVGGICYREYITDDARLTLENALAAARLGAVVANHAAARSFLLEGGRVAGAWVRDEWGGETFPVRARVVVNASGPWAAETLRTGGLTPRRELLPSKGVHLLFRADRLPIASGVVLQAPGGRSGFAIRRGDFVYVGTTDERHEGPLDEAGPDREAVAQLLGLVRETFPEREITSGDVLVAWAGLRPLIAESGKRPRDTSRRDQIWRGPPGLVTIAGGKLTTYRPMARRVMRYVARDLGLSPEDGDRTGEVPLPGGAGFASERPGLQDALRRRGIDGSAVRRLLWLYGVRAARLLAYGEEDPHWLTPLAPGCPALRAEVRLTVEEEMALTLTDVLDRRCALLLFSGDQGSAAAPEAAHIMAALLGWTEEEQAAQLERYRATAARIRVRWGS